MAMGDSSATFLLYPKLTHVQERALLDVPTVLQPVQPLTFQPISESDQ